MGKELAESFDELVSAVTAEKLGISAEDFEKLIGEQRDSKRLAVESVCSVDDRGKAVEFFARLSPAQFGAFVQSLTQAYPDFEEWSAGGQNRVRAYSEWSLLVRGRGVSYGSLQKFRRKLPEIITTDRNFGWSKLGAYLVLHTKPSPLYENAIGGCLGTVLQAVAQNVG